MSASSRSLCPLTRSEHNELSVTKISAHKGRAINTKKIDTVVEAIDLSGPTEVRFPRSQAGNEPQFLLSVVLGDYWFEQTAFLPSSVLADVLAEFGVSQGSARQAMLRLSRRGILRQHKEGKSTSYGYVPRSAEVTHARLKRLIGFGSSYPDWDHKWTIVTFSTPDDSRSTRNTLRNSLRNLGFGMLHDAVWICAFDRSEESVELLDSLGIRSGFVYRADQIPRAESEVAVEEIFDLEKLRLAYTAFIERHDAVARRKTTVDNALTYRTTIMSEWLELRQLDPDIPGELLPASWPRKRAHKVFLAVYDALGSHAERQMQAIIAARAPELASLARHHTSSVLAL